MQIWEVMTRGTLSVDTACSVQDALGTAGEHSIEHLLICDHGEIVGIACAQCQLSNASLNGEVGQYMVPARVIDMGASIEEAAARMLSLDTGALLVHSHGRPVGVCTRGDLLRGGLVCEEQLRVQFFCASCGAHAHVHVDPHINTVAYCSSCMDRASAPDLMDDLGRGD